MRGGIVRGERRDEGRREERWEESRLEEGRREEGWQEESRWEVEHLWESALSLPLQLTGLFALVLFCAELIR